MRIGIVLHPFGDSVKGLEQYIGQTASSLMQHAHSEHEFTVFVKGNPDTSELPKNCIVINLPAGVYWEASLFGWRSSQDLFIFFTESAPFFLWKKSIVVFFDAAYYYFGFNSIFARVLKMVVIQWKGLILRRARHVVTISKASKKDLIEKFHVPDKHVTVIYPGFKQEGKRVVRTGAESPDPFFMYVGPMKERKNVLRIVKAYAQFRNETDFTHSLYLVGRRSGGKYESTVLSLITRSGYTDSIVHKHSVDDTELFELYRQATALVYPSLCEGFGLPILEALSVECPVITSSTTSTKEVLGDAGLLVDPLSVSDITNAMKTIAKKEFDIDAFKRAAAIQCAYFSWGRSAEEWGTLLANLDEKQVT